MLNTLPFVTFEKLERSAGVITTFCSRHEMSNHGSILLLAQSWLPLNYLQNNFPMVKLPQLTFPHLRSYSLVLNINKDALAEVAIFGKT
jgi:hypothetical protein